MGALWLWFMPGSASYTACCAPVLQVGARQRKPSAKRSAAEAFSPPSAPASGRGRGRGAKKAKVSVHLQLKSVSCLCMRRHDSCTS
jgi:hypothetical protein